MKNFKRFTSILLALCISLVSTNISSFASTVKEDAVVVRADEAYSTTELNTIEAIRLEMHRDLEAQLSAQDSMDQYNLFLSIMDNEFNKTYFPMTNSVRATTYTAPNGGFIRAHDNQVEIVNQYLTAAQTQDLYNKTHNYTIGDAVAAITLAAYGVAWTGAGVVMTIAGVVGSLLDSYAWSSITLGVDRTFIVSTYDKLDAKTTTVISKWTNYPTMTNNLSFIGNVTYGTY